MPNARNTRNARHRSAAPATRRHSDPRRARCDQAPWRADRPGGGRPLGRRRDETGRPRAQRRRQDHAAADPRGPRPARHRRVTLLPRPRPSATWPKNARPSRERRSPTTSQGEPASPRLKPPSTVRPRSWPPASTAPTIATGPRSSATSRSAVRTSRPRPGVVCADLGLPASLLDLGMSQLSGGQAATGGAGGAPVVPVRRRAPGRAHQRPRLRRPRAARGLPGRAAAGDSSSSRTTARSSTAWSPRSSRSTPAPTRLTLYRGGWRAYLEARATAPRHAEEAHLDYRTERDRLVARARQQRQWAVTGVRKGGQEPEGQRQGTTGLPGQPHRETGLQGPLDRARPRTSRGSGEALRALAPPSRDGRGAAQRRRRRPARRQRVARRGAGISARSTSRSAGATGSRSSGATAPARRRCRR